MKFDLVSGGIQTISDLPGGGREGAWSSDGFIFTNVLGQTGGSIVSVVLNWHFMLRRRAANDCGD
jgi:hypothetical protein